MKMKSKKVLKIIAITLGSLMVLGASMAACSRSFHKHPDPEKIEKFVLWRVDDRLDDLDADKQQRKAVFSATKTIIADVKQMKASHKNDRHKQEILDELKKGEPDAQKYHQLVDERFEEFRAFVHRSLDTALNAFMVLNQEQRIELIEEVEEHIAEHHSS